MGRLLCVLAIFVLASSSWAFMRPWENRTWVAANPHIWSYGTEYWWDLPALHSTIGTVPAMPDAQVPEGVSGNLAEASGSAAEAAAAKDRCVMNLIASLGAIPWSPGTPFLAAFSGSSGCMAYKTHWKGAVSATLSALEKSQDSAAQSVASARSAYEDMIFMGLCDGNYTGPGSEDCGELSGAFSAIDGNITEGGYGKYALLQEYSFRLKASLRNPVPDLSFSQPMLAMVWADDGVVAIFGGARTLALRAANSSESGYREIFDNASLKKSGTEKLLQALASQKLYLVDEAPSGFDAREAGSIEENLASLGEEKAGLDIALAEAKNEHGRTGKRGYMARAVALAADADDGYRKLADSLEELREDAQEAATQERDEAESELGKAGREFSSGPPGSEAATYLEQARLMLEKGDSAATIGERFSFYSKAAALARAAGSSESLAGEASAASSLASLEELVRDAGKDGINVAEQKGALSLIKSLPPAQAEAAAQEAMDAIISKAKAKYDDGILSARSRINDKLALAGPDAADLATDLERLEGGLILDGTVSYPDAIGFLGGLSSGYSALEETLDTYMSEIVGNAMSAQAKPLFGPVRLDEPAYITLDLVLSNPRPYNASHVEASVALASDFGLLHSDIVSGREDVESVRWKDGALLLSFPSVGPYDVRRVIFEKEATLATTTSSTSKAEGIGDGRAVVSETVQFELAQDIPALHLPDGYEDAVIDGLPASRPLGAGHHALSSERTVEDAYTETTGEPRVYRLGTTTYVEYEIRLMPAMDLGSVFIAIDSLNDSRVSSMDVVSATGEFVKDVKRTSGTQYSAKVVGLKKGKETVVRVSYRVDDTESFVEEQLSYLAGQNMSAGAKEFLEQASFQAASGNHSQALGLIERALSKSREDEKSAARLEEEAGELESEIRAELVALDSALSSQHADSSFIQKLSSRKSELEKLLAESSSGNASRKIGALGKADMKWLEKELNSFRKDSYKQYNGLRERLYAAGESGTPQEFTDFEEALRKLESGGRLEYAVEASDALHLAEAVVEAKENDGESERGRLAEQFEEMEASTLDTLERYSRQASAAKGTDYSSLFTESEKKVDALLQDAEKSLSGDTSLATPKLEALKRSRDRMELVLDTLRNESESKLSMLGSLMASAKVDGERRQFLSERLESMRGMVSAGDYVNALRAGSALGKELDGDPAPAGEGLMVLGLSALAILAAAGFYISSRKKKELRKLTSWRDPLPKASSSPSGHSSRSSPELPRKPPAP
ncbi:MAG: hypothetical protein AB1529_00405 [Candidatus Micrarchaeota archaeon]